MKNILKFFLYGIAAYLLIAVLFNLIPANRPDFAKVFVPNSHFGNSVQGNEQIVLGYHNGVVRMVGQVKSHAEGPPEHVHTNFDEPFSVARGTLSLLVNGERKVLQAGESFTVPKGTYHKFFNETDSTATGVGETPAEFAFILTQLYGLTNDDPTIFQSPRFLLQLSVWGSDFDSYLKDGPPPFVMKTIKLLLLPIAKLAGYQYANEAYYPKPIAKRHAARTTTS